MGWKGIVILAATAVLGGCSTFGQPAYCSGMLEQNRAVMAAKSDVSIAYIATALAKLEYGGECACPDDKDSIGELCGGRSAYSRMGGSQPYCYADQVPAWVIPRVREASAHEALPFECGGSGTTQLLDF